MKAVILTLLSCFILSLTACEKITVPPEQEEPQEEQKQPEDNGQQNGNENTQTMTMEITSGGKTITATLADNATAKALAEKLKAGLCNRRDEGQWFRALRAARILVGETRRGDYGCFRRHHALQWQQYLRFLRK
jgi:hypothetical protein